MAIPSFFKQNKPRGFTYKPRYYDPVKEEMEQRRKSWATEKRSEGTGVNSQVNESSSAKATEGTAYRSKIMRGDMKNYFNRKQEKVQKQTTIRLIVIILIIVLVVYLYLRF